MDFNTWCDEIVSLGGDLGKMNNLWLQQSFKNGMTPHQVVFGPNAPAPPQQPPAPPMSPPPAQAPSGITPYADPMVLFMGSVIRVTGYIAFGFSFCFIIISVLGFVAAFGGMSAASGLKASERGLGFGIALTLFLTPIGTTVAAVAHMCAGCFLILIGRFVNKNPQHFG